MSNHWVLINQPACGDLPFAPMDAVGHYDQRGDRAHFSIGRFTLRVT